MMILSNNSFLKSMMIGAALLVVSPPALPASPSLLQGIKQHNAGNYSQAIGLLGEAESTEFNNPILHYYMADSFVRLKQTADAIREYKIAQSLQPKGKIAEYCQIALQSLGAIPATVQHASPAVAAFEQKVDVKANLWATTQVEELETERKKELEDARHLVNAEMDTQNKRTAEEKVSIMQSIGQFISGGRTTGMIPNPDYEAAVQQLELNNVNKQNELTEQLKRREEEINHLFDDKERAYTGASNPSAARTFLATVQQPAQTPQEVVPGSNSSGRSSSHKASGSTYGGTVMSYTYGAHNESTKLPSIVPSISTPLGMLPIASTVPYVGKDRLTIYVRIDDDGSWTGNSEEKRIWKEELVDSPAMREAWLAWQQEVATSLSTALKSQIAHLACSSVSVTVGRNGEMIKSELHLADDGPDTPDDAVSQKALDLIHTNGNFPAMPSSSHFHKAIFTMFVTKRTDRWWH